MLAIYVWLYITGGVVVHVLCSRHHKQHNFLLYVGTGKP